MWHTKCCAHNCRSKLFFLPPSKEPVCVLCDEYICVCVCLYCFLKETCGFFVRANIHVCHREGELSVAGVCFHTLQNCRHQSYEWYSRCLRHLACRCQHCSFSLNVRISFAAIIDAAMARLSFASCYSAYCSLNIVLMHCKLHLRRKKERYLPSSSCA